jgi:hypothetical protein
MWYRNIKKLFLDLNDGLRNVPTDESEDYVDVHFKTKEDKEDKFKGF